MKLAQEAIWSLSIAIAFLVLGHGIVMGDDPQQPFTATDEGIAFEEAVADDRDSLDRAAPVILSDETFIPLPETTGDEPASQTDTPEQATAIHDTEPERALSKAESGVVQANDSISEFDAAAESEPFVTGHVDDQFEQSQPQDAPCPGVSSFPISDAACHADNTGHGKSSLDSSETEVLEASIRGASTFTECSTDCGWLLEKLDIHRESHIREAVVQSPVMVDLPQIISAPEATDIGTPGDSAIVVSGEFGADFPLVSAMPVQQSHEPQVLAPPILVETAPISVITPPI